MDIALGALDSLEWVGVFSALDSKPEDWELKEAADRRGGPLAQADSDGNGSVEILFDLADFDFFLPILSGVDMRYGHELAKRKTLARDNGSRHLTSKDALVLDQIWDPAAI